MAIYLRTSSQCILKPSKSFSSSWGRWRPPISWFPGHMAKASRQVREKIKHCEVVIEIRDARIPISSVNHTFESLLENKRKLTIYNKIDLADSRATQMLKANCKKTGSPTLFISAAGFGGRNGVAKVVKWLKSEAQGRFKTAGALVMVTGMPNVGKSTLINTLAAISLKNKDGKFDSSKWLKNSAKKRAKVGDFPGVTRSLSSIIVNREPLVRMLDTPGIMVPKIESAEIGLRLALTGAIKDEVVGEDVLVEFLIDTLKQRGKIEHFSKILLQSGGLSSPLTVLDNIDDVIEAVSQVSGAEGKAMNNEEHIRLACKYVLNKFRSGEFGPITLDPLHHLMDEEESSNSIKTPINSSEVSIPLNVNQQTQKEVSHQKSINQGFFTTKKGTEKQALLYDPNDIF